MNSCFKYSLKIKNKMFYIGKIFEIMNIVNNNSKKIEQTFMFILSF